MMTIQQFREWQSAALVTHKKPPIPDFPLRSEKMTMTEPQMVWYCSQAMNLGPLARDWCYRRSFKYLDGPGRNWSRLEAEAAASFDLIETQKPKRKR